MKYLLICCALVVLISAAEARTGMSPGVDSTSGVSISVDSWLDTCPQSGMIPLKVRIHNGDKQSHTWKLSVGNGYGMGGGLSTVTDIAVEGGRSVETVIYAAVSLQRDSGYSYSNVTINISGYGVDNPFLGGLNVFSSSRGNATKYIGMSKKLSAKGWSSLKEKLEKTGFGEKASDPSKSSKIAVGVDLNGSELEMSDAPEDWRGYSALAQLWMDGSEWIAMSESSKAALFDWVGLGGHVYILRREETDAMLKLPGTNSSRHGAGEIERLAWDEKSLPLDNITTQIKKAGQNNLLTQLNNYDKKWPLRQTVGELKINTALIFGFIVIFGTMVGPVNLFWLAGVGRRQRLFWTTPLISLAGSGALIALMMLQDGLGGEGARTVLAVFIPAQKKMLITQEQISKTGVLFGRGFAKEEPSWMQQLDWRDNSKGYFNPMDESRRSFTEAPGFRSGEWFSSRAIQAQMVQSARPSRSAIELQASGDPNGTPSVLSSIEIPLVKVFIKDEAGKFWMAEDVGTGEKKLTKAATPEEFKLWYDDLLLKSAGPVVASSVMKLRDQSGYAFAEGKNASKVAVKSLPAIRWNQERVIFAGPYVKQP